VRVPLVDVEPDDVDPDVEVDVDVEVDEPPHTTVSRGRNEASLVSER
jgi:hypothetical protein